jgi:hypothetical protein
MMIALCALLTVLLLLRTSFRKTKFCWLLRPSLQPPLLSHPLTSRTPPTPCHKCRAPLRTTPPHPRPTRGILRPFCPPTASSSSPGYRGTCPGKQLGHSLRLAVPPRHHSLGSSGSRRPRPSHSSVADRVRRRRLWIPGVDTTCAPATDD